MPSPLTRSVDRKRFDEVRKADHVCREALLLFRRTTCCFYDPTALTSNRERRATFPSSKQRNLPIVCHCDSRYVGCTSQHLEERIKQHIPKSTTNLPTPHIHQSLPRPGKDTSPLQFHESAIGQHLLHNAQCALHYNKDKFSVLARARTPFHLSALEATFIKSLNPLLCKQKEFVYSLKIS